MVISSRWWLVGDKGKWVEVGLYQWGSITKEVSYQPDNVTFIRRLESAFTLSIIPKTQSKKGLIRGESRWCPPYPHSHADRTVHVAFVQPPMLGDPTLLRAEGGSILGEKGNTTIISWYYLTLFALSMVSRKIIQLVPGWPLPPY